MKKLFALYLLIFCTSCATPTRLSDEEVAKLQSIYPDMLTNLDSRGLRANSKITNCESPGECFKTECIDNGGQLKCWKTRISQEAADEVHSIKSLSNDEVVSAKQNCLNEENRLKTRKRACLTFLHSKNQNNMLTVMNSFCKLEGVSCKKNGILWSKRALSDSDKLYSGQWVSEENGKKVIWYYSVDERFSY